MLLTKMKIPLALSLLLLGQTAHAFDTVAFATLDENSPATARAFLALPFEERQKIGLELLKKEGNNALNPAWQVFLAADLAKHLPEDDEGIQESLSKWQNGTFEAISETDPDETPAAGQLCITQLQQPAEDVEGVQKEVAGNLEVHCTKQLSETLGQSKNFEWFTGLLKNTDAPERVSVLQNMVIPDSLSAEQSQAVADALLPTLQAADASKIGDLGYLLDHMENEATANALLTDIRQPLAVGTNQDEAANALKKLVWLNTADSATLFWANAMDKDKSLLPTAKQALSAYIDQSGNDSFPSQFHEIAIQQVTEKQDMRLAATYLSLATTLENDWGHGLELVETVEAIAGKIPSDPENQALLKYVYLQGAGSRYQDEPDDLEAAASMLDKAAAIPGESLSWYLHQTGETEEKRADQLGDFKPMQQLHASGELTTLLATIKDGKAPEKPFKDLPLGLYGSLLEKTITARLSHDRETGAALLLDEDGELSYFNGKMLANEDAPFEIKTISSSGFEGKPTLSSPLVLWFTYWFNALTGDDSGAATSYQINAFAAEEKTVDQRLLFEMLDSDGDAQSYPEYREYVRYGHEILLNLDVDGEIQQDLLVFPDAAKAEQWLTALTRQPPLGTRAHSLWHHTWDEVTSPLLRVYSSTDFDESNITLSPEAADKQFVLGEDEEPDCGKTPDIEELDSHAVDFQQAEYALYRKGYQLHKLYHDDRCEE